MIEVKMNEHDRMLLARITLVTAMTLLGSLAVGIAYAQQQQQQQQGEEWSQYQNATYGVRMLYPSNWTQQNSTAPGDDRFILVSEFFSPEDANGYFADVTIAIDSMPQTTSIESYRSQSIDIYRQDSNFEDLQLLSSSVGNFTLAAGAAAGGTANANALIPHYALAIPCPDQEFGPQNMLEIGTIFDNRVYYIQYFE